MAELDIAAGVRVTSGEDLTDSDGCRWQYTARLPFSRSAVAAPIASGSAYCVFLDLGGPNQGRWWDLRFLSIGGQSGASLSGVSLFITSSPVPQGTFPTATSPFLSLPYADLVVLPFADSQGLTFSKESIPVLYPSRVVVFATGPTTADGPGVASIRGWDRDQAEMQDWSRIPSLHAFDKDRPDL